MVRVSKSEAIAAWRRLGARLLGVVAACACFTSIAEAQLNITITDGQTTHVEESIEAIGELRAMGVRSIGIGVNTAAPRHYNFGLTVPSVLALVYELPKIVGAIIRRGKR